MLPIPDTNDFYQIVFYAAFIIWCVPELIGFFTQRPAADAQKRDRGSRFIGVGSIWVGIVGALWCSEHLLGASIPWVRLPIFWIGCALLVIGTLFRWYSIRILGQYFTRDVAVRPGQQVIQSGPYRLIRHPSYAGGMLSMLGLGLALGNWIGLALLVILPLAGYLYRMGVEEQALLDVIGEPYRDYMRRTRRLIPFVY